MTRRKHQPTADQLRAELARAATALIHWRHKAMVYQQIADDLSRPWYRRLWARIRGWFR